MDRMLAGVSTRRFPSVGELMSRQLEDVRLPAMMIDGLESAGRCYVVCLGITTEGVKIPVGPRSR